MNILKIFLFLTILTGGVYPALVTVIGQSLFSSESQGSLIKHKGRVIGSSLLAQKFTSESYFHPRPSVTDYATIPSGASQKPLRIPSDMLSASGSGLDPHISPESARAQVERIARARKVAPSGLLALIDSRIEKETLGILGRPRVNVLELNMDLVKDTHGNGGSASQ